MKMIHRNIRILRKPLIAAALLAIASAPAFAVKPFTADYTANYMGLQGNGTMTLAASGSDRYTYTLNIRSSLAQLTQSTRETAAWVAAQVAISARERRSSFVRM